MLARTACWVEKPRWPTGGGDKGMLPTLGLEGTDPLVVVEVGVPGM